MLFRIFDNFRDSAAARFPLAPEPHIAVLYKVGRANSFGGDILEDTPGLAPCSHRLTKLDIPLRKSFRRDILRGYL